MIAYRSTWMGIAMLWIMIYHTNIVFPSVFKFFKMVGYGGVDIFIFASGIGNYYSYLKDKSPLDFLKRRIIRLAPAYLPVIIVWCIYYILKEN